jgi:hypothetical protein
MDDQDRAARLAKAAVAASGLLLLLLVARSALGDVGLLLVALLALGVVVTALGGQAARRREALVPSLTRDGVPDTWRSERWIAEAVERGLRALDEWRWEQRQA